MKKLLALFSSLGIVLVAAFALLATPALAANPLLCFADAPGTCLISSGIATLNNTSGGGSGVYTAVSSLTSKTLAQVNQLSFSYTGTPTAGSPRISLPVDMDANGTTDVYAFIGANLCNNGSGLVDAINNLSCKIFITGGDVGGYTGWAAFVTAFPSAKVGPDVPFVIADDAGLWTVSNIHLGTEQAAYTQADFKAFDGVSIGTNSYTISSGITATYTSGIGTETNPVNLKLTGYAPIVTPWFGQNWTTYNYVTVGIKLPAGFTGTSVYQTGIMRYDVNPAGAYKMSSVGDGSTPLATAGAALGYLDYSFAANSTNTTKDGLVKLQVIWTAGGTPEYFTIDINGLQLDTLTHLILTVPAATTITRSTLVPETSGVPTAGNAAVDTAIVGLTPIAVTLANTGNAASANVRISPIGASSHIQLWAKDTSGNWFDINVTGWGPTAGFPVPVGSVTTNVYIISDLAGTYPLTANLVLVSNSSIVAHATGTVTVNETAAEGCVAGNKFNTTTGRNCNAATPAKVETPDGCAGGDKFSITTGRNCNAATPAVPARKVLDAEKINFGQVMRHGSKGNDVVELQKFLNVVGQDSGQVDGKFGPKTKEAVIKFQNAHGLKGDGVVGTLTREALNK